MKIFNLDDYEFDRIKFLLEISKNSSSSINYLNDNQNFLSNLLTKTSHKIFKNNKIDKFYINEVFEIYPNFHNKFSHIITNEKQLMTNFLYVYLPLSKYLYTKSYCQFNNKPLILGVQAHQGCGKTTLTDIISYILKSAYNINSVSTSIDDYYLKFEELQKLKVKDPRFKFRGPPGTHDLNLLSDILNKIRRLENNFYLPLYDKSANQGLGQRIDNRRVIKKPIDVLLFEGWFIGSEPVDQNEFSIYTEDEQNFQKLINDKLKEYVRIWNFVDFWMVIRPKKYQYSKKWRSDAEKKNKQGMKYHTMQEFLNYFWLTVPPEIYFSKIEDRYNNILTLCLDKNRNYYI